MSRFADPGAMDRLPLGACQCPDTPHDEDWVELRKEFGGLEWQTIATGTAQALGLIVVAWSFVDSDGFAIPITTTTLRSLDVATFQAIDNWIDDHLAFPELPNASGAPSRNGSRASASHTRTTPKRR